jgi:AraC-like DNA-binding protein
LWLAVINCCLAVDKSAEVDRTLQASPSEVAKTARVQRAKRLIDESSLPMTEIAMRAGFGSLRRLNSVFAEVYGRPPSKIRRARALGGPDDWPVKPIVGTASRIDRARATMSR